MRGCWKGQTYTQIAERIGYGNDYIRDVGFQLWRRLSQTLDERVSKSNFKTVLRHHTTALAPVSATSPKVDWGTAADVPLFFGRNQLVVLIQWFQLLPKTSLSRLAL